MLSRKAFFFAFVIIMASIANSVFSFTAHAGSCRLHSVFLIMPTIYDSSITLFSSFMTFSHFQ